MAGVRHSVLDFEHEVTGFNGVVVKSYVAVAVSCLLLSTCTNIFSSLNTSINSCSFSSGI